MRYRTTIEIVTDAEDKNEAVEIVGEYLSGNLVSGVEMKCLTKPAHAYNKKIIVIAAVVVLVPAIFFSLAYIKIPQYFLGNTSRINAIQPPLKTSDAANAARMNSEFKKEWESKQRKEAIDHLKK